MLGARHFWGRHRLRQHDLHHHLLQAPKLGRERQAETGGDAVGGGRGEREQRQQEDQAGLAVAGIPAPARPPRLFSEPSSGPKTEFCLFFFSLSSGDECPGATARRPGLLGASRGWLALGRPVLCLCCCVGGKDCGSGFYSRELYLRTFFFIGGPTARPRPPAPALCCTLRINTFSD